MTAEPDPGVPLTVHLRGLRVVVIGGGPVALAKLRGPLEAGADVHVVAPDAVPEIRAAAEAGELVWHERPFVPGDLDAAALGVAATSDPTVNDAVAQAAADRATLCVRVDGGGSASFAGAVRRGPLTLAVSTGGAAPALARRIRAELADQYGEEHGTLAALLGELRADADVRATLEPLSAAARAARWRRAASPDILALIRTGHLERAKEVARTCLLSSSD